MKRNYIVKGAGSILTVVLFGAIIALNYFTKKKMGMARHMAYLNGKWEMQYPLETLKMVFLVAAIGLVLFVMWNFVRSHQIYFLFVGAVSALVAGVILFFPGETRAYYGSCFMLYIWIGLQWITTLILSLFQKKIPRKG